MYLILSRFFFLIYFFMSLYIYLKHTPEERKTISAMPQPVWLVVILTLLPLFVALPLPEWLSLIATVLVGVGFVLVTVGRMQLIRANSYSMGTSAATTIETRGMFRWMEHPIYTGMILLMVGWSLWMPLTLIATVLLYRSLRESVRKEREYMTTLGILPRGLDSNLW
jgi:protein-S-isoprenylcysteine O-methyltransferase Ste14